MRILFLSLLIVFDSCSSTGQTSLIGEWKPVKVSVYNVFSKTTSVYYDKNNQESVKEKLLSQYVLQSADDSEDFEAMDTIDFRNKLDSDFLKFDSARIFFKDDSTVIVNSYGLIIPTAFPGWHFGDKVAGKWTQEKSRLKLMIGDSQVNYPFFYKIIKQTNDGLVLGFTNEDYEETYMISEFTRQ